MDFNNILYPALVIGGIGIVFGLILGIAGKIFAIKVDPLVEAVKAALPGVNCGACGYTGCDPLAKAIVGGEAAVHACPVGGASTAENIGSILGIEAGETAREVAFVKCNGTCETAKEKYIYDGAMDCKMAHAAPGKGSKACEYGCLGLGTCVRACQFDAIDIVDGIAIINEDKCTRCGMCVKSCPKRLIEIIPTDSKVRVQCNSREKGKDVKASCSVGCIACRLCVKACEFDAIIVEDNIAKVDYEKCTMCNACAEKCPVKIITSA
ncbi:RnfABCDGE-type electron transport complex B subunit [Natranaerovirga pectinivora]|uniref:Ion-translocating oxidoreductase complex subunit B n=1 Tax=Natranaerovirga pectinivora TaxID=682400 RepID=A0A4R3MMA6_9FIRM|nr:RnfABCDGE type electron transport complex subunit B [Natranaerovirga pectinivora]TCT14975.1 RnfABCDGE-type electron transport complex B subunit [Natranaerovirga pectinivora]